MHAVKYTNSTEHGVYPHVVVLQGRVNKGDFECRKWIGGGITEIKKKIWMKDEALCRHPVGYSYYGSCREVCMAQWSRVEVWRGKSTDVWMSDWNSLWHIMLWPWAKVEKLLKPCSYSTVLDKSGCCRSFLGRS